MIILNSVTLETIQQQKLHETVKKIKGFYFPNHEGRSEKFLMQYTATFASKKQTGTLVWSFLIVLNLPSHQNVQQAGMGSIRRRI